MSQQTEKKDKWHWLPQEIKEKVKRQVIEKIDKLTALKANVVTKDKQLEFVLGVSGGIDSAVCFALAAKADIPVKGYFLDIYNQEEDYTDAVNTALSLDKRVEKIVLNGQFNAWVDQFHPDDLLAKANLKARLRMVYQYMIANLAPDKVLRMVVGTENLSEHKTGYFTKFGDAACDISLIDDWTKTEVFYAAHLLDIPEAIIDKHPSAGLYYGQYDEAEMGVTYEHLDKNILGITAAVTEHVTDRILELFAQSEHKRCDTNLDTILNLAGA